MAVDLQMKNFGGAGSSGTSAAPDELRLPISCQPGYEEAQNGLKLYYPPSPALLAPISEENEDGSEDAHDRLVGAQENTDHTITVPDSVPPEPHICRICTDPDEEKLLDDVLVKLGCHCKGQMSMMHRKCILPWYGVRMILDKNYKCELCNALLSTRVQHLVCQGVADRQYGGRDILIRAVESILTPYAPHINVESAATYQELVHLLLKENMYPLRRHRIVLIAPGDQSQARAWVSRTALFLMFVAIAVAVGLYTYFIHHHFGNVAFH